ncbi:MAG TPA: c-type cytochrome, partial [Candidatus Dormibacteraeota bacterium]|nr:c-type cytochrome [Candidatus Dormibacteraeota bacterium]
MSRPLTLQLTTALKPVLQKILAGDTNAPVWLVAQLLAARLGLAQMDVGAVRARFVAAEQPEAARLQSLEALIAFGDPKMLATLPEVLRTGGADWGRQVVAKLGRSEDARLADVLLGSYATLPPELQPLVIELLMQREPWARKVLDAVLTNALPRDVLHANHLRKILDSNDREAIWAVEKAFGSIRQERSPERERIVQEMAVSLREHLGDPERGQVVFRNLCAQCHTIYGQGGKVGPDLTANGRASFDQLLSSVFDPSLVIGPGYQVTTVVTKDGRNLTGLIAEDNEQRVVIRLAGEGEETIPRQLIKYTRASKLSMMPEGIETWVPKKDLADLFAFLALDKPATDPHAAPIPGAPPVVRAKAK